MNPIDLVVPHRCMACYRRIKVPGLCVDCLAVSPKDGRTYQVGPQIQMTAVYAYDSPVGTAIRYVKTHGSVIGAAFLHDLLAPHIAKVPCAQRTFIPAPWVRARRRGLDLPQWLAGPGARRLFIRYQAPQQTGANQAQRLDNPAHSIGLIPSLTPAHPSHAPCPPMGEGIWGAQGLPDLMVLIDDVRTTGATGVYAASLLVALGMRVHVMTLAGGGKPAGQLADVWTRVGTDPLQTRRYEM